MLGDQAGSITQRAGFGTAGRAKVRVDYASEWIGGACFSLPSNHWQTYEKLRTLGRHEREFQRIAAYIEENPVSAGLAATPEEWPWSSATTAS